jgi:chemotaxis protein CheX
MTTETTSSPRTGARDGGADDVSVTTAQISSIAQEVWESLLGMSLLPHPLGAAAPAPQGRSMTGCVHVHGEWNGSVFLQCDLAVATAVAEVMFAAESGTLSDDEISDALGELTNMVGGNIKSLLPAPSRLSVPTIAVGEPGSVRVPGAVLLDRVVLMSAPGPLHISIWKV